MNHTFWRAHISVNFRIILKLRSSPYYIIMLFTPIIKSLRGLVKLSQAVRSIDRFQRIGSRPVFVLGRGMCDNKVPPEVTQSADTINHDTKYIGDTRAGLRCGRGDCWDESGHYSGEWVSDVRNGHGIHTFTNGIVYEGMFADDLPNGFGKLTWPDGTVYEGKFEDGVLSDESRYLSISGVCMKGNIVDGMLDGVGKIKSTMGIVLEGEFDGREFTGVMTCLDGTVQEGEFTDFVLNGKGKTKWSDGMCSEGMFVKGRLHGQGKLTDYTGFSVEGNFKDGKVSGWCKCANPNGFILEGNREDGKFFGPAKYTHTAGTESGSYLDDNRHGLWTTCLRDGTIVEGHFENGVMCGRWTFKLADGTTFDKDY